MLQSDQFCLLTNTSVRRRMKRDSYLDGIPYISGGIGRPGVFVQSGIGSGWVTGEDCAAASRTPPAPAAKALPASATPPRRKARRPEDLGRSDRDFEVTGPSLIARPSSCAGTALGR